MQGEIKSFSYAARIRPRTRASRARALMGGFEYYYCIYNYYYNDVSKIVRQDTLQVTFEPLFRRVSTGQSHEFGNGFRNPELYQSHKWNLKWDSSIEVLNSTQNLFHINVVLTYGTVTKITFVRCTDVPCFVSVFCLVVPFGLYFLTELF